jgi:diguanylate cyclase (GGDEF)-like protein
MGLSHPRSVAVHEPLDAVEAPAGLARLLAGGRLRISLQPIVRLADGTVFGYEALSRGPAGSALEAPAALFAAARAANLEVDLDLACAQAALARYGTLDLAERLFVNLNPVSIISGEAAARLPQYARAAAVFPGNVVIELTETHRTRDFARLRDALAGLRASGFALAIDDLGEGFASLRLWSELQPDYVKIDRHFVSGIHLDPLKHRFVKAIEDIAHAGGSKVVAEGIEIETEFAMLRDLGIEFGQGWLIGRPSFDERPAVSRVLPLAAGIRRRERFPDAILRPEQNGSTGRLTVPIQPVTPHTDNDAVFARFEREPELTVLPVVDAGRPLGLITRYSMIDRFARPFWREVYGRKPCTTLMEPETMIVDAATTVQRLSGMVVDASPQHLAGGFLVTEDGCYVGVVTGQALLREITRLQISAARYANPLTMLPGNVPIAEHCEMLLAGQQPFVVAYCDLNAFKAFNDQFGFRRGDDVILGTARVLSSACDAELDFIGHIGGDDFMLLMRSADWEARCREALAAFERLVPGFVPAEVAAAGGYASEDRRGQLLFHELPSLAIGALCAEPGAFHGHLELAEAATEVKRHAKRRGGNCLFIDRRRPRVHPPAG